MTKELDDNSYEKRIENIEKGKSYLNSNGFFRSKSNLFEDIQRFILKKQKVRNPYYLQKRIKSYKILRDT